MEYLRNLQTLYLNDNQHISYFNDTILHKLKHLLILEVSRNIISEIPDGTFEYQNEMILLNLTGNMLTAVHQYSFKGLVQLITLDLKHNEIADFHNDALLPLAELKLLNLSYNHILRIPGLPLSLTGVDMRRNNINAIQPNAFAGLTQLEAINLMFNRLTYLPRNAFVTNKKLIMLQLAHNNIAEIDIHSFPTNAPLEMLILHHNNISNIVVSFSPEYFPRLKTLDLSNNKLEFLVHPLLSTLFPDSIEELLLSWNKIYYVSDFVFKLPNLRVVDLKGNNISTFSNWVLEGSPEKLSPVVFYLSSNPFNCNCHLAWLKRIQHKQSDLYGTRFIIRDFNDLYCHQIYRHRCNWLKDIPDNEFLCKYQENCVGSCSFECCSHDDCPCRTFCPANCTCYRNDNWADTDIIDCTGANLTSVPEKVSPAVATFELSGNNFPTLAPRQFDGLNHLRELILDHCSISNIDEGAFEGQTNLTSLDLGHNFLQSLNQSIFAGLSSLSKLILSYNGIGFIGEKTFEHLNALHYLDLAGNNIKTISRYVFETLSHISSLKMSMNPWSCECNYLERMKNFSIKHAHKILDFADVTCMKLNETTHTLEYHPLADVNLPDFCQSETVVYNHTNTEIEKLSRSAIAAMSTVFSLTALGLVIFGVVFRNREFLKVWCFVKFGWKFTGGENKEAVNRPYDAFISYSSHDEEFIVQKLVPHLEGERNGRQGYRLCVHYRDFAVGASIAESIIAAVELSKRVIIVLSDNFLNSEWCQYEFQAAHHQLLEERKNRIIMVLLHDINHDMEDHQLKDYIKTRTYLEYGDPWFWAKLDYAMPKFCTGTAENRQAEYVGPQHDVIQGNIREHTAALGDDYIDDEMQYIIDNMRNYETDDPKL